MASIVWIELILSVARGAEGSIETRIAASRAEETAEVGVISVGAQPASEVTAKGVWIPISIVNGAIRDTAASTVRGESR